MRRVTLFFALAVALLAAVAAGCGSQPASSGADGASRLPATTVSAALPQGGEPVQLDPATFTSDIDNPYWPMKPGTRWVYSETDAQGSRQRVEITVTNDTRTIIGIQARVVHDVVTEGGQLIEDTYDWYAQDVDGNIWYLGESTKEYENGKVKTTAGSWEAGVDGAQPGIVVLADPVAGLTYRQEYYEGEAEDAAAVLSVNELVRVPAGSYENVLMTKDYTPLVPAMLEYKFYARDVGPVLVLAVSGGSGREELVRFESAP